MSKKRRKAKHLKPAKHAQYVEPDVTAGTAPAVSEASPALMTPDELFARRWLAGEVGDTFGNMFNKSNIGFSEPVSALGPVSAVPVDRTPPEEHKMMGSIRTDLLRDLDGNAISADSDLHPLNRVHVEQRLQNHPPRPLPDSLRKQRQDGRAILASFKSLGYSR